MIDLATRSLTAAVLRPTTKSVDASVLLARTVTPEPMRPGWVDVPEDAPVGAAAPPSADAGRTARARRPAGDRPGDDRLRPRQGLHLAELQAVLPLPGDRLPAHSQGFAVREGAHRADARLGGLAVRPVPAHLHRPQARTPRPEPGPGPGLVSARAPGPAGRVDRREVAEPAARRTARPVPPGPAVHPEREVRRARRGLRLRSGRPGGATTTSSCCRPSGGRSTTTA